MWDYLFDPNPNNPPVEQRISMQAQLFSHQKIKCSIEITNLHCVGADTPYMKYKLQRHVHRYQILESPTSFIGAYCAFLRHWGDQTHCAFTQLGGSTSLNITHTRLISGHDSDTN